ncbi:MAG: ribosome-associated translation inhibitor RaiA [Acidobacteriota bacterium]|nr:ribosome-associated translation inhibitor RaiA [Acidobacteriota bacterium]
MKIEYTGRNLHIDDRMRELAEAKLQKLTKFLEEPIEVRVILEIEKYRHIAELLVTHRLGVLQATEETNGTMQDAFHLAAEKAEKQARRSRKKLVERKRRADRNGHQRWPVDVLERETVGAGAPPRVVESTHLTIKPMSIEEAAMALETSEYGFVVFRDSGSDRLSVLYRRKDDNYGLIAPEEL